MKGKRIVLCVSLLAALATAFGGCAKSGSSSSTSTNVSSTSTVTTTQAAKTTQPTTSTTSTAVATKTGVLKIGMSNILSGSGATYGVLNTRYLTLTIDEINAAGGIRAGDTAYQLQFIDEDNKYTADGAVTAATKLLSVDKVQYLYAQGGVVVPPTQALSEPLKVIVFANAYTAVIGPKWPYTFRTNMPSENKAVPFYQYVRDTRSTAKVVSLIDRNDVLGFASRDQTLAAMQVVGGFQTGAIALYEFGTKDFAPSITKLIASKPDVIDLGAASPGDAALMIEGLRQQGFTGPLVYNVGVDFASMIKLVGTAPLEGLISDTFDASDPNLSPNLRDGYQKFVQRYGAAGFAAENFGFSYDATYALKAAMEKSGSIDPTTVKQTLEAPGFTYRSIWGTGTFAGMDVYGINHQIFRPVYVTEFQNGKVQVKKSYSADQVTKFTQQMWPIYQKLQSGQ